MAEQPQKNLWQQFADTVRAKALESLAIALITGVAAVAVSILVAYQAGFNDKVSFLDPIPAGTVIASVNECDRNKGWVPFREASSRFIIGASTDETLRKSDKGADGEPLTARPAGEPGGQESVTLSKEHLPSHGHQIGFRNRNLDAGGGGPSEPFVDSVGDGVNAAVPNPKHFSKTGETGKGESHENMPPFIALHFCEKVNS